MQVSLPFEPRWYQADLLKAMNAGCKRACAVWHRRAGKEMTCFNWMVYAALQRVGIYYYFFPSIKQGKRILWFGMDRDGHRWIDYYLPKELIESRNETDLRLRLKNGSLIQVLGLDAYKKDDIVGTGLMGAVFSEYSIQDEDGWKYMSPVLAESGGWAIFNFTPRGYNHAKDLYDLAQKSAATDGYWYCSKLSIEDTNAISLEVIDQERRNGMPEEIIQQEYYCSFSAGLYGAYFASYIQKARDGGRIGAFPAIADLPVHTAWDIGVNDPTAIWFFQKVHEQPRIIGYYEKADREGLPSHARYLQSLGYHYGTHIAPHDMKVDEWGSGETRWQKALNLGLQFDIMNRTDKTEQIEAARTLINRAVFDATGCAGGLKALDAYEEDYDKIHKVFTGRPRKSWANHGADALQTLALGFPQATNDLFENNISGVRVVDHYDVLGFETHGINRQSSERFSWYS